MGDGHLGFCKTCVRLRVTKHREDNIEKIRAYDIARYKQNPKRRDRIRKRSVAWRKLNPEKYVAQSAVSSALRCKRLKKLTCLVCGRPDTHGHHEDYSKPLDVMWLCTVHHSLIHKIGLVALVRKIHEQREAA